MFLKLEELVLLNIIPELLGTFALLLPLQCLYF